MSSPASFYLIDISKLKGLAANAEVKVKRTLFRKKRIDAFPEYLAMHARPLEETGISGYLFTTVLIYLDEKKGIHLLDEHPYQEITSAVYNKRESTLFIFTPQHKQKYGELLSTTSFSLSELQEFNKEFSQDEDDNSAQLALEAIGILDRHLQKLSSEGEVLLLVVGG